jgi:hypothetical protein
VLITFEMPPRVPKTFKLDERLIQALNRVAEVTNESAGSYVEKVLWRHLQGIGELPITEEPPKDQRGGKRTNSGRKKRENNSTESADN